MTSPERPASALELTEAADAAEAEAAAAEAEARAAAARARAIRLRRQAEAAAPDHSDGPAAADPEGDDARGSVSTEGVTARPRRLRHPSRKAVAIGAAFMVICASLAASGYMAWQDRVASQQRQRSAEYVAAAREDIAALMSLDFTKTQESLQRIADHSTGTFKKSFPMIAQQLTKGLEQAKVTTTVTVHDVAVESMTDNSATVLVAATTEAKGPDGPPQPRSWQIALGLSKDGGQLKMANVEFVQ